MQFFNEGNNLRQRKAAAKPTQRLVKSLPAILLTGTLACLLNSLHFAPVLAQTGQESPVLSPELVALADQIQAQLKTKQPAKASALINHYKQSHICGESFYIAVADAYNACFLNKTEHDYVAMGVRQFPNSFALHLREAQYWLRVSELEMAEPEVRLCLKIHPNSTTARAFLAKLYNERMDFARGLKEIDAAIAQGPVDSNMWLTRANALNNLGRVEEAVTDLDKAVRSVPMPIKSIASSGADCSGGYHGIRRPSLTICIWSRLTSRTPAHTTAKPLPAT